MSSQTHTSGLVPPTLEFNVVATVPSTLSHLPANFPLPDRLRITGNPPARTHMPQPDQGTPPRHLLNGMLTPGDRQGPEFEAFRLLGDAWRSPVPATIWADDLYHLVDVPEDLALTAWHHLRRRTVCCGAIFATSSRWTFFVPAGSGDLPWPASVDYVTGRPVRIPPRAARDGTHGLWWVSRPTSGLFTAPIPLAAALNALIAPLSSTPARNTDSTHSTTPCPPAPGPSATPNQS
ncbi:hypothetical protein ACWD4N_48480 [Streptomyces sp. NPDC002586]